MAHSAASTAEAHAFNARHSRCDDDDRQAGRQRADIVRIGKARRRGASPLSVIVGKMRRHHTFEERKGGVDARAARAYVLRP